MPREAGNALTAMMRRERIEAKKARRGMKISGRIPLRYTHTGMKNFLSLAEELGADPVDMEV